jgi:hypothetical protein
MTPTRERPNSSCEQPADSPEQINLKDDKGKMARTKAKEANFPAIVQLLQVAGGME